MAEPIHLLHLEDDPADRELIPALLGAGGFEVHVHSVAGRDEFAAALARGGMDVILADCRLPAFDGMEALALARERRPEVPFLFVSGYIGEEAALDSLRHGATDYVFKHNLGRLVPSVRRALAEARAERSRREAEAALQEREATLASFFNTAPFLMGVVEIRPEGLVMVSANAAAARFAGTEPDQLRGLLPGGLEGTWGWLQDTAARLRQGTAADRPLELEVVRMRDGRPQYLSVTASRLAPAPGQLPRFCFVAADVTGRRELEQQFLRAQRLESVGTLASGLAHDLNNVLAPMQMSLRVFRAKLTEEDEVALLDSLESSVRRGRDILRQLLTFASGTPGAREPVRLGAVLEEVARMARETFPLTITVETRVGGAGLAVTGDATQLYQVVLNLCLNAREAMPEGGVLRLGLEEVYREAGGGAGEAVPAGPYALVTVEDTGQGIPAGVLGRIFDPFFTTKPSGTGLGLATAAALVRSHGGFITVTSELGRGSVFRVFLPGPLAAVSGSVVDCPVPALRAGAGATVLLVDDEDAVRRAGGKALRHQGYRVLVAAHGAEALRCLGEERVDVVVTDLMMPVLGGSRFLERLAGEHPGLPVVAMSGVPGQAAGGPWAGFLAKPFPAEALLAAVERALADRPQT